MSGIPRKSGLVWACSIALSISAASAAFAENWPQWRGPQNNGISSARNTPVRWSKTDNVAWRLPLPGFAGSTPITWGEKIFLTSADGSDLVVICVSSAGEELWRTTIGSGNRTARGDEGNSAAPSPSTDGKHVWVFMGTGHLACLDLDGNIIWDFNLQDRYGSFDIQFGMTSSPVLYKDKLYLQIIHGSMQGPQEPAYVVAVDKATGKQIWKTARKTNARTECKHSYASPLLYDDGSRRFLITHGADYVVAYDLDDGSELWRCGGLNPFPRTLAAGSQTKAKTVGGAIARLDRNKDGKVERSELKGVYERLFDNLVKKYKLNPDRTYTVAELERATGLAKSESIQRSDYHPTLRFVASPSAAEGLIVVPSAKRGAFYALRADLKGDATFREASYLWRKSAGTPDVPSPLIHQGLVYICSENGILRCLEADTGEDVYEESLHRQRHRASPVFADGKVYLTARDGVVSVVKAGRKFELLAQNRLEESVASSPVFAHGVLYLRSYDALYAIKN